MCNDAAMAGRSLQREKVGTAAARVQRGRKRRRAALRIALLGCAIAVLAVLPAGAQLLTEVVVTAPGAGAAVTGSRVVVEARGLVQAEAAQARILASGQERMANLSGPEGFTGGSRWVGNLDLTGLPNGVARVEGRAQFSGNMSEWSGHDVHLDLPAPAITLHVSPVAGRSDAVSLAWPAAGIPDVSSYELQRALAGAGYEPLVTVGADQLAHTDVGLPPGDHRYRVRAVRPGGSGGAKPGPWAEGVAILAPSGVYEAEGGLAGGPGPTSGVATRPPTGGISARLRSGTEGMSLPEMALPDPQVAPRDVAEASGDGQSAPSGEEVALGGDQPLAVTHGSPTGGGADGVRLVALSLVALLALRAHHITHRPARASPQPMHIRLSAGPPPGGGEAWRGARDWSATR